jgi:hypothetical protein
LSFDAESRINASMSINGGYGSNEEYGSNERLGEHFDKMIGNGMRTRRTSQVNRERRARKIDCEEPVLRRCKTGTGDERGCYKGTNLRLET